uniref:Dynein regulatory complex subunit 3 n=1 Tax=Fundulus heteroclitus TaxID=8078 RepID=A0A3Q2Q7U4_FUNHE
MRPFKPLPFSIPATACLVGIIAFPVVTNAQPCKLSPAEISVSDTDMSESSVSSAEAMEFLRDFTSLVRLDLNNNLIEKIWGLDHLTNLTWLNLSLNRIKNIEGLESLRKLQLLNLSNNQISLLENMDTLENLKCLPDLVHILFITKVLYLRRFKNLFKLSIAGNPFNEKDNHSFYIAAFLPNVSCRNSNKLMGSSNTR